LCVENHLKVLKYPNLFSRRYGQLPESLVIRESYNSLYELICTNIKNPKVNQFVALVTGVPGIGKSMFILYFIYRYLQGEDLHKKSFVIQYDNHKYYHFHSFINENNEFNFSISKLSCHLYTFDIENQILLVDFKDTSEPMNLGKATIIHSSPNEMRYKQSMNSMNHFKYYLPTWSYEEIKRIDEDENNWRHNFEIFGGVPRSIFSTDSENKLAEALVKKGSIIASCFSKSDHGNIDSESCYMLLHINPLYKVVDDVWIYDSAAVYTFASNYVFIKIYELNVKLINSFALDIFNIRKGNETYCGSSTGNLFEKLVLFVYPLNSKRFDVTRFDNSETFTINVPSVSHDLPYDWDSVGLELNKLYIPKVSNLESGNSFFAGEYGGGIVLVVFQITVGMEHPIKSNGLKAIFESFRCNITLNLLVFVTPTSDRLIADQKIVTKKGNAIQRIPDCFKNFKQCYFRYSFASECKNLLRG